VKDFDQDPAFLKDDPTAPAELRDLLNFGAGDVPQAEELALLRQRLSPFFADGGAAPGPSGGATGQDGSGVAQAPNPGAAGKAGAGVAAAAAIGVAIWLLWPNAGLNDADDAAEVTVEPTSDGLGTGEQSGKANAEANGTGARTPSEPGAASSEPLAAPPAPTLGQHGEGRLVALANKLTAFEGRGANL
jgi:hypothetical protein